MFKAILSSPIGFAGSTVQFTEVDFPSNLAGYPHFVGHPATKQLLGSLGAEFTPGRFAGLEIGESFLAVPLAPTQSPRPDGMTAEAVTVDTSKLKAIVCTRIA